MSLIKTPSTYVSPLAAGTEFEFVSGFTVYPKGTTAAYTVRRYDIQVLFNGIEEYKNYYQIMYNQLDPAHPKELGENVGYTTVLKSGTYKVIYTYEEEGGKYTEKKAYTFAVVQNQYPLKPPSIKEAIERLFDIETPLTVYGYGPQDEERGRRASELLKEIENEPIPVAMSRMDNSHITPNQYLSQLSRQINFKRSRAGGIEIDLVAAVLYQLKERFHLSNEDMPPIIKNMTELTYEELAKLGKETATPVET